MCFTKPDLKKKNLIDGSSYVFIAEPVIFFFYVLNFIA